MAIVWGLLAGALPLSAAAALVELEGVSKIDAGGSHACVLTTGGAVKCWGGNAKGQLGDGGTSDRNFAGDVSGLSSGAVDVAASKDGSHACAIVQGGGVKCWGANDAGQLGDGTTTQRVVPVDVLGLPSAAVAIAAGGTHTCAILAGGELRCWGGNAFGQLGDGSTAANPVPTVVSGLGSGVASVSAGSTHTCAVTTLGALKCWGANRTGQLGDGSTTDRPVPVEVVGLASGVVQVSAGGSTIYGTANTANDFSGAPLTGGGHTCAVTAAGGVKCWGANESGQLGDGTRVYRQQPVDVIGLGSGAKSVATGGWVTKRFIYFLGFEHSCATTETGAARCWGSHHCGTLGNGEPGYCMIGNSTFSPTPVDVLGLSSNTDHVSAGASFNCAATTEGRARCWGGGPTIPVPVLTGVSTQSIAFGALNPVPVGGGVVLFATGGASGNPIVMASLTPATCSVSGATVTGIAPGLCTVAANQAGNAYFTAAPQVTADLRVGDLLPQSILWGSAPSVVVGGAAALAVTATSGLPVFLDSPTPWTCSVEGYSVRGLAPGTCAVTATAYGNAIYDQAPPVTLSFPVTTGPAAAHALRVEKVGAPMAPNSPAAGTITSNPAGIDCGQGLVFICQAAFATGTAVTLTPNPATNAYFAGWEGACSGMGACTVTMNAFTTVRAAFGYSRELPRLGNIATRTKVLTGDEVLIGGFIIGGTAPKTVIVRARGPSLSSFGIANPLGDPKLDLYSGQSLIGTNDDWASAPNALAVQSSGFAPANGRESAILTTLAPGPYTAVVSGVGTTTGVAIVEVFEIDRYEVPLANISTRGKVLTGEDVMIGGFVIQGAGPRTVVVRARGPSLSSFGIVNPLADPVLQLFQGQTQIAVNDNWMDSPDASGIATSGLAPSDPRESVIRITLAPGAYTAIVTGKNGGTGVGIIEVFAQ